MIGASLPSRRPLDRRQSGRSRSAFPAVSPSRSRAIREGGTGSPDGQIAPKSVIEAGQVLSPNRTFVGRGDVRPWAAQSDQRYPVCRQHRPEVRPLALHHRSPPTIRVAVPNRVRTGNSLERGLALCHERPEPLGPRRAGWDCRSCSNESPPSRLYPRRQINSPALGPAVSSRL
jgi:hypothetical protein